MAENTSKQSQIDNAPDNPAVESTTTVTPAEADKTSVPNALDAKANQPPVRTNRPDVPIAQTLAAGAGEHFGRELNEDGVDKDGLDADGRFVGK